MKISYYAWRVLFHSTTWKIVITYRHRAPSVYFSSIERMGKHNDKRTKTYLNRSFHLHIVWLYSQCSKLSDSIVSLNNRGICCFRHYLLFCCHFIWIVMLSNLVSNFVEKNYVIPMNMTIIRCENRLSKLLLTFLNKDNYWMTCKEFQRRRSIVCN